MLALGASTLVLLSACATGGGGTPTPTAVAPTQGEPTTGPTDAVPTGGAGGTILIGSAGFYESALMAEIYAQVLEANGFTVERQLEIGPRDVTLPSLIDGEIDMMPEYIGSTLEFLVRQAGDPAGEASGDPAATAEALAARAEEEGLTVLGYTEAQDSNAFVVRQDTADEHSLTQMSDLAAVQTELTWGLPPECETNPLCGGALTDTYGIDFATIEVVELGACGAEIATALNEGAVDIGELCSTQPDIVSFGFVVLEDDQATQPAENIAPIFNTASLDEVGGAEALAAILDPVSAAMDTETLTELNVRVGVEQEDYDVVATDWLTENGLLE
jgi:osmoprotectant transport system substrate-binding protein